MVHDGAQIKASGDVDLVHEMLRIVRTHLPDCSDASALAIEADVRSEFGGRRHYVDKKKWISEERRQVIFQDGLSTDSNEDIMKRHGISRASLYRLMKRSAPNK